MNLYQLPARGLMLLTVLFASSALAETPTAKKEVSSLDARLNSLQESRNCIDAAQNREAVQRCRANIKITKKQLRDLRKEARKENAEAAAVPKAE